MGVIEVELSLNRTKVILGDWSGDGHNITETYIVEISCTNEELQEFYRNAVKKSGIQFENICEEYEDAVISGEIISTLTKLGVKIPEFDCDYEDENDFIAEPDNYLELLLNFCKLGGDFKYKVVNDDVLFKNPSGYGYSASAGFA